MSLPWDKATPDTVARLIDARPRGVVIIRSGAGNEREQSILDQLRAVQIPLVAYGPSEVLAEYDSVFSDQEAGGYELTRWLIRRGHRRILRAWGLCGIPGDDSCHWIAQRDAGYERACREAGIAPIPAILVEGRWRHPEGANVADVAAHMMAGYVFKHIHGPEPIDAILALADGCVPSMARACRILGKQVHRDIAIVGYDNCWPDNVAERAVEPVYPLATIDKRNADCGRAMVELLEERISQNPPPQPQHRGIAPELIVIDPERHQESISHLEEI